MGRRNTTRMMIGAMIAMVMRAFMEVALAQGSITTRSTGLYHSSTPMRPSKPMVISRETSLYDALSKDRTRMVKFLQVQPLVNHSPHWQWEFLAENFM